MLQEKSSQVDNVLFENERPLTTLFFERVSVNTWIGVHFQIRRFIAN